MREFKPEYHDRDQILAHYQEERNKRTRKRKVRYNIKRIVLFVALLVVVFSIALLCGRALSAKLAERHQQQSIAQKYPTMNEHGMIPVGNMEFMPGYTFAATDDTTGINLSEVASTYGILVNVNTNEIICRRSADTVINPASMTKILTVLVAAEALGEGFDDTATYIMPHEVTDYAFVHKCSTAGFVDNEVITVRDLFYGTILPSGGEAAQGLAYYVSGSQDAFVELMNKKLESLGLSDTAHFTNAVGLYDTNHHCTVADMAVILKAAVENDYCREVLAAHVYTTSSTEQHPEGIVISNWFLRRIEDKDAGGEVKGAKTGFVNQSGNCAASYFVSDDGVPFICVTGNAYSSWRAIYDHVAIYKAYTKTATVSTASDNA